MMEQVIQINYPHDLLNTPVINKMIQRYPELGVNILQAKITSTDGMLELKLVGKSTIIESCLVWLKEIGMIISILD